MNAFTHPTGGARRADAAGRGSQDPWQRHRERAARAAGWSGTASGRRVGRAPRTASAGSTEGTASSCSVSRTSSPEATFDFAHPSGYRAVEPRSRQRLHQPGQVPLRAASQPPAELGRSHLRPGRRPRRDRQARFSPSKPTPAGRAQPTWNATSGTSNDASPPSPTTPPHDHQIDDIDRARLVEPASDPRQPAHQQCQLPCELTCSPLWRSRCVPVVLVISPPHHRRPPQTLPPPRGRGSQCARTPARRRRR